MPRAALFDMDGVLAFTEPYYRRRRLDYLARNGIVFDSEPDWTGMHDDDTWRSCVPDGALRARLRAGYERYADEHPTPWRELVNPQAAEVIATLRDEGVATAICSSSPRVSVDACVRELGVATMVDCVISGDECSAHKPEPEIYLRAMRRLGVTPDEAVVVEDSPIGIRAGKAAGALVCALRPPDGTVLDQGEADVVLGELREVLALFAVCPIK